MAGTDVMMPSDQHSRLASEEERTTEVDGHAGYIVGVRFRDSARVSFFNVDDLELAVGTWVLVPASDGNIPARVVIAPRQVVLSQLVEPIESVVRLLVPEEAGRNADLWADPEWNVEPSIVRVDEKSRMIGGLGKSGSALRSSPEALIDPNLSCEHAQYRIAKQKMPQLGQRVNTEAGDGTVVSLQVFKELVTVRYDNPAREETYPAADLMPER
jgi:hypothetical protein